MEKKKEVMDFNKRKIPPKITGGPGRYIQGAGALDKAGDILKDLGQKPMIISDTVVWTILGDRIEALLAESKVTPIFAEFGGECCHSEIDRLSTLCHESGCDAVIGLGGGKTLDTAKSVSKNHTIPVIIIPTIASNDAPTSRIIVIYNEDGALIGIQRMAFNPNVVLVDTSVIASAPVRFLIAGIGDALPTKFEAEQSYATGALNMFHGRQTHTSLVLADTCYQLIRKHGLLAKMAVEHNLVTESLELVVEANVYLSGQGFESGGLAAAHALTRGFSVTKEMHGALHGEEVAFGLLIQLVLENRSKDFLDDFMNFYRAIGLPCTLSDLGLNNPTDRHLQVIAERTCEDGSHIHKMSMHVDEKSLIDAILMTDALGKEGSPPNSL